ncbi:unnamed protein product [Linum tenue]|uniref:Cytochrome P450 n=1 Tax=Linum tenue TaxID=586396 RepID=A0AAV0LTE4_9ROSI|nr:unnamed protein product [Linum tenue]
MELLHQLFIVVVVTTTTSLFIFFSRSRPLAANRNKLKKTTLPLPPSPPTKLPLIGHMHHLATGGDALLHQALRDLAHKHGPAIMHLQLGQVQTIVVSSAQIAEAFLKTHDVNFAQRPPAQYAAEALAYGSTDIVFAPYGDYWRQLRKICTVELFSARMIRSFGSIREDETSKLAAAISAAASSGSGVDLSAMFCKMTYGVLSRAAFGEAMTGEGREAFLPLVGEITRVATGFNVADFFPSFKLLQVVTGVASRMSVLRRNADEVLDSIIAGHRKSGGEEGEDEDLLSVLLKHRRGEENLGFSLTTDNIKAVLVDLFFAGTETTATSLEWAMSELVKNPRVMQKAQSEVRRAFGPNGKVDEARLSELVYLKMVIRETMRLHPPAPMLLPRTGAEDCEIGGYRVPAGYSVIVNAWAIGRDPEYWADPETFWPERFLDGSVDYKGIHFQLIPFGAGRRICPGMSFAVANIELPLAWLIYRFDWKLPYDRKPECLDMTEAFGAAIKRKNRLFLVPSVA